MVHVPPSYTSDTQVPLVIDFHGYTSSANGQQGISGWSALADAEGFIVVWPSGVGSSWNAGRCCGDAYDQNVDDVGFIREVIATLKEQACVDSKRVYATGCSNGGGMSYRLACEAADVIAGVAPVDFDCIYGDTNDDSCGSCVPSRTISEIQFRGTDDFLVPYEGGSTIVSGLQFPGAEANFANWADINDCSAERVTFADNNACEAYTGCKDDVEVALCTMEGGSHCGSYATFDIAQVAWNKLRTQTLP